MIKRFPKGFGMKIIFRIFRSVEKYFQKNFFGYGEGDFGKISTVKYYKGCIESKTRKAKGAEVNILHKKRWFDVKKLFFNKNILGWTSYGLVKKHH